LAATVAGARERLEAGLGWRMRVVAGEAALTLHRAESAVPVAVQAAMQAQIVIALLGTVALGAELDGLVETDMAAVAAP
jgi:hypothetical protein